MNVYEVCHIGRVLGVLYPLKKAVSAVEGLMQSNPQLAKSI